MNDHIRTDRLHDYVDDLLCREERAEVERHLVVCDACAGQVGELRDLTAELARMPAVIAPERDLLADVHTAIATDGGATGAPVRGRGALLAAAVVIILAGGAWWLRGLAPGAANGPARTDAIALQQVERDYQATAAELQRLFAASAAALDPETRRIVNENLAVIDRALAEARAALRDDPGNPVLEQILLANHEKKLDLLRGAARAGT